MQMLKSFAPWITFSVVTTWLDWRVGIAVGLVLLLAVWLTSHPRRLGLLGSAQLAFFVVMGTIATIRPDAPIASVVVPIALTWLAVVSGASLLAGRPFTLDFSRDTVSPAIASSPIFLRTNKVIAQVWTGYFAASAALGFTAAAGDDPRAKAIQIVILVVALKFTIDYPKKVRTQLNPAS
jgi:uncharacterized membrane protein